MKVDPQETIARAQRINRTWITRGTLADNTQRYFDHLAATDPARLEEACKFAITFARQASGRQEDPKLAFYAALFSASTKQERDEYLKDHFFTRILSTELQHSRR